MKEVNSKPVVILACWIILAILLIDWAARFVLAEHTIYTWDNANFWLMTMGLADTTRHNIFQGLWAIVWSLHSEYNAIPMTPAALVMAVWGDSRLSYILANVIFWAIPALSCILFLLIKAVSATWTGVVWSVMALSCLLLTPLPWIVTLLGYEDVGGLICACIATVLLIRSDIRSRHVFLWVGIGAALALLALFRRWFVFLSAGLLMAAFAEAVFYHIRDALRSRTFSWQSLWTAIFNPVVSGVAFVGIYGVVTFPLSVHRLKPNYSHTYSAYQQGDTWWAAIADNVGHIGQYYGVGQLILALISFLAALGLAAVRREIYYVFVPAGLAAVLFSHVQSMGYHQALVVCLGLVAIPLMLSRNLVTSDGPADRFCGWALLFVVALLAGFGFQRVFLSSWLPPSKLADAVLPQVRFVPERRHDLPQIEALLQFIAGKVTADSPSPCVYLLSSSTKFNSWHLACAGISLDRSFPVVAYISRTHDIDARDGFPDELVTARLVLVAVPLQTHLTREQKVVTVPVRLFLAGQGFAQAFVKDPESFILDGGIHVYAYDRVRPSTPEEIAGLHQLIGVPSNL